MTTRACSIYPEATIQIHVACHLNTEDHAASRAQYNYDYKPPHMITRWNERGQCSTCRLRNKDAACMTMEGFEPTTSSTIVEFEHIAFRKAKRRPHLSSPSNGWVRTVKPAHSTRGEDRNSHLIATSPFSESDNVVFLGSISFLQIYLPSGFMHDGMSATLCHFVTRRVHCHFSAVSYDSHYCFRPRPKHCNSSVVPACPLIFPNTEDSSCPVLL